MNRLFSLFAFALLAACALVAVAEVPRPRPDENGMNSVLQARPGFTVELVASEPLVVAPVAFDWGADGKLWVVEMRDDPLGLDNHGQPGGRIVFLAFLRDPDARANEKGEEAICLNWMSRVFFRFALPTIALTSVDFRRMADPREGSKH